MTLVRRMRQLITPARTHLEGESTLPFVLRVVERAILVSVFLLMVVHVIAGEYGLIVPYLLLCSVIVVSLHLIRRRLLEYSSILLSWGLLVCLNYFMWTSNGVGDAAVVVVPGLFALSSLVMQRRNFFVFLTASLLSIGVLGWWEIEGSLHIPRSTTVNLTWVIDLVVILAVTGVATRFLSDTLLKSLARSRDNERIMKQQRDQLKKSQGYYHALFEGNNDAVFIVRGEDIADCNDAGRRMFGCETKADIVGHSIGEFSPEMQPDGSSSAMRLHEFAHAALGGEHPRFYWRHSRKDGSLFDAELSLNAVTSGEETFILGLVTDISERKLVQESLQNKTALLEAQLNSTVDGILVVDNEGRKTLQNQRAVDLWKLPLAIVNDIDDRNQVRFVMSRVKDPQAFVERVTYLYGHPNEIMRDEVELTDGTVLDRYSAPVKGPDGKHHGRIWVFRDVTDRKRAEEQILASLQEKELLLKEIHHRVKNNLQVVSSLLSMQSHLLKDHQAREGYRDSMRRIRSIASVHEMLYQAENFSRIDFGEYLESMAKEVYHSLWRGEVELSVEADNIMLGIDTAVPCGLIANELLSNSLKHAFPAQREGAVVVTLRRQNEQNAELAVQDNGIGFPASRDFREMTSMGFTLVNLLAEQISGTIALERNGGTKVVLSFPV
ncbi:MAG TPA: histidine kinase dimerization/phosphoacceptor domain -containing protein [Bacteroidota bacterium]|nr:histidine kinase dimerization/phosphoacceptor domain -containing protein [Bacteroidota bacterium]